jgi:hypothetical protein
MKLALAAPLSLTAVLFAAHVQATPFQFASGLVSPDNTITFDEVGLASGTVVTNQYAGLGVSFTGTWQNNTYGGVFPNISGGALTDFQPNFCPCGPTFEIAFTNPVSAAVFAFVTNPGTSTLTSYLGATLVESANFSTGGNGEFTGFTGSFFDRIVVSPGGGNFASVIDNLEFNTVPEPTTLALLGAGLVALRARRRRARRIDTAS